MSHDALALLIFWLSLALLFYTYAGYPIFIFVLGKLFSRSKTSAQNIKPPAATVVLSAFNEEKRIITRLQNLLAADYPKDRLNIVLVSDGSTDGTIENANSLCDPRIKVLSRPNRSGKAACLNAGLALADGEIVIFADVRQRFKPDTIGLLVRHFNDPKIGAVSGSLEIDSAASAVGAGVDVYWKIEKMVRFSESLIDSSIGCTGAIYAIRRKLFRDLPTDTLLDDVVTPMEIAVQGFRVLFDPAAIAFDPQSLEPQKEKGRKQRTLAGNFQMLFRYLSWLFPWKNRLWWQLISHKYLRLVSPLFLITLFVANAMLLNSPFYRWIFFGHVGFYVLAILGNIFASIKWKLFSIPAGFVFLNCMVVCGFQKYVCGSYKGSWPITKA